MVSKNFKWKKYIFLNINTTIINNTKIISHNDPMNTTIIYTINSVGFLPQFLTFFSSVSSLSSIIKFDLLSLLRAPPPQVNQKGSQKQQRFLVGSEGGVIWKRVTIKWVSKNQLNFLTFFIKNFKFFSKFGNLKTEISKSEKLKFKKLL